MKLGHDIEWSGHLAGEKTYQRIAVSFFWPEMKKEIMEIIGRANHVNSKGRRHAGIEFQSIQ